MVQSVGAAGALPVWSEGRLSLSAGDREGRRVVERGRKWRRGKGVNRAVEAQKEREREAELSVLTLTGIKETS